MAAAIVIAFAMTIPGPLVTGSRKLGFGRCAKISFGGRIMLGGQVGRQRSWWSDTVEIPNSLSTSTQETLRASRLMRIG